MPTPENVIPSHNTQETPIGSAPAWVLLICFLVVLIDGFDTTSIAFVAPAMAAEWGLERTAFTPAFIGTSIGAVIGYMICGPLAHKIGARAVGVASIILFGGGTLLTALATDITSLSILRLVSAIGLGGILPIAVATGAGAVADRHRVAAAMLIAAGLSAGSVVGGLVGGPLIRAYGWQSVFVVGGVLPFVILPFFYVTISNVRKLSQGSSASSTPAPSQGNPIAALFRGGIATQTALLWTFSFLIFVVAYALIFWLPSLMVDFGFPPSKAPLAAAAFGMGGLTGNLVMLGLVGRIGIRMVLAFSSLFALCCIVIVSKGDISAQWVLPIVGGLGAGLITGCVGQSALAVSFYPSAIRETGVGWSAASGRIGSIFGPAVGGALLAMGWPTRDVLLTAVFPIGAAMLLLGLMALVSREKGK